MQTFLDFNAQNSASKHVDELRDKLRANFGFNDFRQGQLELIQALLEGRDALGVMPTGGGKSLCFQFPALLFHGTAIVVSPLIALMKDQVDALKARGVAAEAYNSSLFHWEKTELIGRLQRGEIKLLYIAPERIQNERFIQVLKQTHVSFLAVDEAHCISHWGHDFRPDYMKLNQLRRAIGFPPCIALTATATARVQNDIVQRLELFEVEKVVTGFHRQNLRFEVEACSSRAEKLSHLKQLISEAAQTGSALVYASTRKNVEWVTDALNASRIAAASYHAGMSDADREFTQNRFQKNKTQVLVATNAFGMGIDKADVRLVTHFDIPGSMEAYYQEAGRAGRDGNPARCVLLFNHADVSTQEFLIDQHSDDASDVARDLLKQLVRYAYSKECRQHTILEYFGDEERTALENCGHCDRCTYRLPSVEAAPAHLQEAGQHALKCIFRMSGRFGKARVAEVLKGSNSVGVRSLGLQHLPAYGLLRAWRLNDIKSLLDQLIRANYVQINGIEYPTLDLTERGRGALFENQQIFL